MEKEKEPDYGLQWEAHQNSSSELEDSSVWVIVDGVGGRRLVRFHRRGKLTRYPLMRGFGSDNGGRVLVVGEG